MPCPPAESDCNQGPDNAIVAHNLTLADPGYLDPSGSHFLLRTGTGLNANAHGIGGAVLMR